MRNFLAKRKHIWWEV